MELKKTIFTVILSIGLLGFSSCSDDKADEKIDEDLVACAAFQTDSKELMNALTTYSQNPSPDNCEAYKAALLQFAKAYKDCKYWTDDLQQSVEDIKDMDCSGAE